MILSLRRKGIPCHGEKWGKAKVLGREMVEEDIAFCHSYPCVYKIQLYYKFITIQLLGCILMGLFFLRMNCNFGVRKNSNDLEKRC